jgi:glucose-6-phosphate isomerase
MFNSGIAITPNYNNFGFDYGSDCFGPDVEVRMLDDIRKSLSDPDCIGPEKVYAIAMDTGKRIHRQKLDELHLLFGLVTYAAGRLGSEPVRSQGHVHKRSVFANNWSTPEVYEIWSGEAIIYMQEEVSSDPGRCFAVRATPGQVVIVPPGWAHCTISVDSGEPLTFGAWCDRDFGFEYEDVRAQEGLAWFPIVNSRDEIEWKKNPNYRVRKLKLKPPRIYNEFGIDPEKSIYTQFEEDPQRFQFVPRPDLFIEKWIDFIP